MVLLISLCAMFPCRSHNYFLPSVFGKLACGYNECIFNTYLFNKRTLRAIPHLWPGKQYTKAANSTITLNPHHGKNYIPCPFQQASFLTTFNIRGNGVVLQAPYQLYVVVESPVHTLQEVAKMYVWVMQQIGLATPHNSNIYICQHSRDLMFRHFSTSHFNVSGSHRT